MRSLDNFHASEKGFTYGFLENVRVIEALVIRTAVGRFSKSRLGVLWVLAEPAAFVAIFVALHTYMGHAVAFGESGVLFILSGVFGFRMTRALSRKAEKGITNNRPLLTYPLVRPLDTIIATFLFEAIIWMIICGIFMAGLGFKLDRSIIVYPGDFVACLSAILYFSFSFAALNAVLSSLVPRYETALNMMNLPLMLMSGVFYMPVQLPPEVQAIVYWNPFLHCVEWFRTSTYLDYIPLLDKSYLLGLSTFFLVSALTLERYFRRKIIND